LKYNKLIQEQIGTAKVTVDILPKGHCIPNTTIVPKKICTHMTGNVGASASANHRYMKNINKSGERCASWHFTVGYDEIIQAIPTNKKAYHAGTTIGNNESIAIEICMYNDKQKQLQAYLNAVELIKILLKHYGWDSSKVVRHYDYSKKHCPQWLIEGKWGYTWSWFKKEIAGTNNKFKPYLVKIIYDGKEGLNVRNKPSMDSQIVTQVHHDEVFTIVEEKNGFLKLKSGIGWISGSEKYVKKL
jgi:uncharacterized protein YgiM (DUF1202 family)